LTVRQHTGHRQGMDLHTAARNGDVARMLELIGLGADLNARDKHSRTALHMAAWAGQDVSTYTQHTAAAAGGPLVDHAHHYNGSTYLRSNCG
jgi:ankyrin repeat protein